MIEVRNIGKADLQRNVGNPACVVAGLGQQGERFLQPQFVHARSERRSGRLQQPLQIARRDAQAVRHRLYAELRVMKTGSDMAEGGLDARGHDRARVTLTDGSVRRRGEHDQVDDMAANDLTAINGSSEPGPFK